MQPLPSTLFNQPSVGDSLAAIKAAFRSQFSLKTPFFIRVRLWEYWPFAVVYVPVFVYLLWLSLKARSFFFFSAANPSIESGRLLGESKIDILDKISDEFKPKTLYVSANTAPLIVAERLAEQGYCLSGDCQTQRG